MMESKSLMMGKSNERAVMKNKQKQSTTEAKLNLEIRKIMLFQVSHVSGMDSA